MHVRCQQCGVDMEVPPRTEGKQLRCPECGFEFICELPRAILVGRDDAAGTPEEIVLIDEVDPAAGQPPAPADDAVVELSMESALADETPSADEALAEMSPEKKDYILKDNPRQWHVLVGGVAAVALTYAQLKQRAAAGEIKPRTKLWYAPKDLTVSARDIPGLFGDRAAAPAEPSAPEAAEAPEVTDAEAKALAEALDVLSAKRHEAPSPDEALSEEAGEDDPAT